MAVEVVYSKYITLRNGKRLYAWQKGLKAFRFEVDVPDPENNPDQEE